MASTKYSMVFRTTATACVWFLLLSLETKPALAEEENGEVWAEEDNTEMFTFFCLNCGGNVDKCCDGVMGLSFCCSGQLYALQKATGIASFLEKFGTGSNSLATCQSNDDCPTAMSTVAGWIEEDSSGDYCCPLENMCCDSADYFVENLEMFSLSFGGPIIFSLLILLTCAVGCGACMRICWRCSGGRRNGFVISTAAQASVAINNSAPGYQKLENESEQVEV